jgi:hypothetical protein
MNQLIKRDLKMLSQNGIRKQKPMEAQCKSKDIRRHKSLKVAQAELLLKECVKIEE